MKIKRRFFLQSVVGLSTAALHPSFLSAGRFGKSDDFSVVIMSDPQVMAFENKKAHWVSSQAADRFKDTIEEINKLKKQPAFVLINGDLVEAATKYALNYYASMAKK